MVFVRRQIDSIRQAGVETHIFYLRSRVNPVVIHRDITQLRSDIQAFRPDLVHCQYGTMTAFICSFAVQEPLIITFRGSDLNPVPSMSAVRSILGKFLSQLSVFRASRIICVSRQLRERLWWRRDRVIVMPNGTNLDTFRPQARDAARDSLGWPKDRPIILFNAGREPAVKRLDLANAAIAKARVYMPDLIFHILDGHALPLDIPMVMNAADCLLVTSDWEGSPNVIKEAMACNLPVVSVDVGDVRERLTDVTPSRIVARDPDEIAIALRGILRLGTRSDGRIHIKDLSEPAVARKLLTIYEECAAQAVIAIKSKSKEV